MSWKRKRETQRTREKLQACRVVRQSQKSGLFPGVFSSPAGRRKRGLKKESPGRRAGKRKTDSMGVKSHFVGEEKRLVGTLKSVLVLPFSK